ncbi:S9 family peptidase, partial [Acidovorax sp. HMWF018]|uniref:alpha/beta hydrolase family protein n=1 Tax=Acidovorax sp. HMWF018 TaxID=2056855 RepID=UPI001E45E168
MLTKNLLCLASTLAFPWLSCGAATAQPAESPSATTTAWPSYMPDQMAGPSESPVAAVLPPDVAVTPPAASVPLDKARWSGLWQGWACMARACDVRIAVEAVTAEGATLVYAAASEQQAQVTDRSQGRFVGNELHTRLHTGARLVLRLREGRSEMEMTVWRPESRLLAAGVLSTQLAAPPYTRVVERLPTPWADADGRAQTLEAVVYRPINASGPLPTVVFNHGSTGRGDRPEWFRLTWTSPEVAQYFTAKGWQVVFPQRRGRGKSDGVYDEGFGVNRSMGYSCQSEYSLPGFDRALADLDAFMAHLQQRPDVDKARLLIGGVSRGGILSVAYAGSRPSMFLGVVNFVGGWLGDGCKESAAVNRAGFIRGAAMPRPTLWLYGERDSYYTLENSRASFEAFRGAGGQGRMVGYALPPGRDGHEIYKSPSLW